METAEHVLAFDGTAPLSDRPVLGVCLWPQHSGWPSTGGLHGLGRYSLCHPAAPEDGGSAQMVAWAPAVTCRVPKPAVCAWPRSCNKEPRLVGVRDGLSCCAENAARVTGCSSPRRFGTGGRLFCSAGCFSQACLISLHRVVGSQRVSRCLARIHHGCSQNSDQAGSPLVCFRQRFLMPGFGYGSWRKGAHEKCVSPWLRGMAIQ